jgi:predicted nucleic acid-binding protein
MIILDTNVISAFTRHRQDVAVLDWMDRWDPNSIWTTSICLFELEHGIRKVREPEIREELRVRTSAALAGLIRDRILAFDATSALIAGEIKARRQLQGRSVDDRDLMIASIALVRSATLVTRNVRHFEQLGLQIVNPWDQQ